ncbi:putative enoyl-CoA hydratase echA8 [bioreactor metagenome]|uniref:Putative enoyl-CoA hydratase echA8 n=1 Tax=bioreactor metagenome TaxID=1076179 RepID=A0A645AYF1_9ZZZZ
MQVDVVYLEKQDGIGVICLNQPKKKNAISAVMMDLITDLLNELEQDDDIRVIVLRGAGEHFCAGGDLDQPGPSPITAEFSRKSLRRYTRAIRAIRSTSKPVVAMVGGYAVGGAVSMMLACDLVCVAADAKIIPNFCAIGLVPELGIMATLPAAVGPQRAKEILFLGERMTGVDCLRLGIANRVFPAERLEEETMALAQRLGARSSISLKITKGIMNSAMDAALANVLEAESIGSPLCSQSEEFKAIAAKFAKR